MPATIVYRFTMKRQRRRIASEKSTARRLFLVASSGSAAPALVLLLLLAVVVVQPVTAFSIVAMPSTSARSSLSTTTTAITTTTTLFAAKKDKKNAAALAALEALEKIDQDAISAPLSIKELKAIEKQKKKPDIALVVGLDDDDDDEPQLSRKELLKLKKKGGGASPNAAATPSVETTTAAAVPKQQQQQSTQLSKKELALEKALELEAQDVQRQQEASSLDGGGDAPLSKKELKALQKKEEKLQAKLENKKLAKKLAAAEEEEYTDGDDEKSAPGVETAAAAGDDDGSATAANAPEEEPEITLEDKIRKERPPPRIRVMEGVQPGYTSLRLENVGITFRNQVVLKDVTWGVQTGDRIGLVGANGAGKTTQLRILAGELEPTTGDVVKSSRDVKVAMLRQEFVDELVLDRTLREELLSVFAEENQILQDIKANEAELETITADDGDRMQAILDKMQELQNKAEDKGIYTLESKVQRIMDLMGFTEDEGDDLVASFSGGWKMRIGLGKVLLADPTILLLDEPSNHLDLESVEWLESFLRQQTIPMVIVSHDREFLDQVCTKIVDAEGGICTEYDGNYSRFLVLKKARMDAWQAAFKAQEKKISEEKQWINKFKVIQPQAVKQRQAKLEKFITSPEYVQKPPFIGKPFRFRFPDAPRLSPEVADIKGVSHAYRNEQSQNRLFDDVELFITKGDRIAVVGPNGSGKSTLLRLLVGKEKPDKGMAGIVGQNVDLNYFEQNQADVLDLDKTVLETIQGASSNQSYNELRALLGQFLFKGDSVDKKVVNLSGGEKARLSLCCMMLRPANLLILDEPTNHLDIPAKEMLEEALQHYAGSVVVVSHDRYFISQVATSIVAIEDKKLVRYIGDYKTYMEKSKEFKERVESRYIIGVQKIESAPIIDLEAMAEAGKKKNFGGAATAHMVTRKDKGVKNAKRMVAK